MNKTIFRLSRRSLLCSLAFASVLSAGVAQAAEDTLKIAMIDPFSGGNSSVGEQALKALNFYVDRINAAGGVDGQMLEVSAYDNNSDPQEALIQAQRAIDSGARFLYQGISAGAVGAALADFVAKHNERNPGQEVIYFNIAANDALLTNDRCQYWHYQFSSNTDMKTAALVSYLAERDDIKKVYLINPDFTEGRAVEEMAVKLLAEKRPDIEVVGSDLPKIFAVTDYSPYIARIRSAGADAVISSSFAQDMSLIMKAAADARLDAKFFTFYANNPGGPIAMKQANMVDQVYNVVDTYANNPSSQAIQAEFRAANGFSAMVPGVFLATDYLMAAVKASDSTDPVKIAAAMEGMRTQTFNGDEAYMRPENHQLVYNQYVTTFGPVTAEAPLDEEGTGWGWLPVKTVPAAEATLPTTCELVRPE